MNDGPTFDLSSLEISGSSLPGTATGVDGSIGMFGREDPFLSSADLSEELDVKSSEPQCASAAVVVVVSSG